MNQPLTVLIECIMTLIKYKGVFHVKQIGINKVDPFNPNKHWIVSYEGNKLNVMQLVAGQLTGTCKRTLAEVKEFTPVTNAEANSLHNSRSLQVIMSLAWAIKRRHPDNLFAPSLAMAWKRAESIIKERLV